MSGKLTTHVLDLVRGAPANRLRIDLADAGGTILKSLRTNLDGRTDEPMLGPEAIQPGVFELRFHVGEYFEDLDGFLEIVPVRFRILDAALTYHVPLLCTPWAYSTYRGS